MSAAADDDDRGSAAPSAVPSAAPNAAPGAGTAAGAAALPPAANLVAAPGGELWSQLQLATPLAAQQLGLQVMGAVDTAILGHYSASALAGAGVATGLVVAITCVGMGIVMGIDAVLPRALGAGDHAAVDRALRAGLRLAVMIGVPAMLLILGARWLLPWLGSAPDVAAEAQWYMLGRAPGVIPFLLTCAMRPYLVAHGKTWPILAAVIGGNVLNVGADGLLVFGDRGLVAMGLPALGLPALGTLGAALATSLVQLATVAVYAQGVVSVRRRQLGDGPRSRQRGDELAAIVRHGVPIGLQLLAEVSVFAAAGVMAAHFGTAAAAAHSVALSLASFTFGTALGVGGATAVRVGLALGLGGPRAHQVARRRGFTGLALGLAVMAAGAAAFLLVPRALAGIFTSDPAVVTLAVPLLGVAAVFQLSDGAQAVISGALRGASDTRSALWANVFGHYAIGLPISLTLAFMAGLGTIGLWWGLSAGLIVTSVILIARFWRITEAPAPR